MQHHKYVFTVPVWEEEFCDEIVLDCEARECVGPVRTPALMAGRLSNGKIFDQRSPPMPEPWLDCYLEALSKHMPDVCRQLGVRGEPQDVEPYVIVYDETWRRIAGHVDDVDFNFTVSLNEDYEGGGTYFPDLDLLVHTPKGHAIVFPGKLYHCTRPVARGSRYITTNEQSTSTFIWGSG